MTAAGLNNTDVWTREGRYGRTGEPDAESGWRGALTFPLVQGGDACGWVEAVGDGVDRALVGRRVVVDPATYSTGSRGEDTVVALVGSESDGAFCQALVVRAEQVHDVSTSPLSDEQLACLPIAYGTAAGMLGRGNVQAGETVVVTGASGGVGLAGVQLAKARGARVVAVSSAAKASLVAAQGADVVIPRDEQDVVEAVRGTCPGGVDVVLDVTAGRLLEDLLPIVRDAGRWVVAGALGGAVVPVDLRRWYLRSLRLIGSTMHTREQFAALVASALEGAVEPQVAASYPLAQFARAQETFLARDHVGKVVVTP